MNISPAYEKVFQELVNSTRYQTYSVYEFYVEQDSVPNLDRVNVVVRVDVDNGFHLSVSLAETLKHHDIQATFYFLTHPDLYYNIWGSGIPKRVAELGFEVGLHTDHYYEQLTRGIDGLSQLKADIQKLSEEAGTKIRGIVYHGHPEINAMGKSNWELTKGIPPQELGLDYHDGLLSCYIKPGSRTWAPKCDIRISDFMGLPRSWGWNYYPGYPLRRLRGAKTGDIVHIAFHTKNAFEYWRNWDESFGEQPIPRENPLSFYRKAAIIQWKYGLLKEHSIEYAVMSMGMKFLVIFLAKGVGKFWPTPQEPEPDTSWETGRKRIYDLGIPYWRRQLEILGMTVPGGKVLEVGSGNGQWLIAYAQDAEEVIGIEPSKAIREYSLERIAEYPKEAPKIKVLEGVAEDLPFPDQYFDRVLCVGVLMFTQQDLALKEMSRVLKPGGKICLTTNGLGYFMMRILNGFRYKSTGKMKYGLRGILATLLKWWFGKQIPGPKAVNSNEMDRLLSRYDLMLYDTRIYLAQNLYPKEHLGFPTNYAFLAGKKGIDPEKKVIN